MRIAPVVCPRSAAAFLARRARHRLLVLASLALLFVAGPVHVWHHVDDIGSLTTEAGDGSHCIPCSSFHKIYFVATPCSPVVGELVYLGVIEPATASQALSHSRSVAPCRAPPASFV